MVAVVAIRELENCLDGVPVREFVLDQEIDESLMRRVAVGGKLQYFPHFPRPYFRIDCSDSWAIQGIIGNTVLRVTLARGGVPELEEKLRCLIQG